LVQGTWIHKKQKKKLTESASYPYRIITMSSAPSSNVTAGRGTRKQQKQQDKDTDEYSPDIHGIEYKVPDSTDPNEFTKLENMAQKSTRPRRMAKTLALSKIQQQTQHQDVKDYYPDIPVIHDKRLDSMDPNKVTELPACEEEFEDETMAQKSTKRKRADKPFAVNKKIRERNAQWDERFKELVDFKKINGHANVSTNSGPLGHWVKVQRRQYRLLQDGEVSLLTIDQWEQLESIGFEFRSRTPFDLRFQELVDFKAIHGHTNVPNKSGDLGKWVSQQRTEFRYLKEGQYSCMTIYKIKKLESIGFEFRCRVPWDQRFQELVDYKKINGHTNVPTLFRDLGNWVSRQRTEYRFLKEGQPHSCMTIYKIKKLEGIGFEFKQQRPM
jgi:hypothetical protein